MLKIIEENNQGKTITFPNRQINRLYPRNEPDYRTISEPKYGISSEWKITSNNLPNFWKVFFL